MISESEDFINPQGEIKFSKQQHEMEWRVRVQQKKM